MEKTEATHENKSTLFCKSDEVNAAIVKSFERFFTEGKEMLQDLALIMRDELAKVDLYTTDASLIKPPEQE